MTPSEKIQADVYAIGRIPIIDTILEVICQTTGMGFAAITRITDKQWIACAVLDKIEFGLKTGGELKLETTLCHKVNLTRQAIVIDSVKDDELYKNHHTPAMYGFQSYISVPIIKQDGSFFGTLCAIDPKPNQLNNPTVTGMFNLYSDLISFHLKAIADVDTAQNSLSDERVMSSEFRSANESIKESEKKFRLLVEQSPVAMIVLRGPHLLIDTANPPMLALLGKTTDVLGKSLVSVMPELAGQQPYQQLLQVLKNGKIVNGYDTAVQIEQNGVKETGYYNFTYAPLREDGLVTGVITMAVNVTEQVQARKQIEQAEESLRIAIDAAKLGSWNIDPVTRELKYNATLAKIFGYEGAEMMTYDQAINQVTADYRQKIVEEIDKAIREGSDYNFTYRQKRFNDHKIIWLRSFGKVNADKDGNPIAFAGFVMDITEQKRNEQLKNDFIGMVSHELKTPLTSMKGYIQMLQLKASREEDGYKAGILEKADKQVNKMTTMINGFLNISRLESGQMHINKQSFDLKDLVREMEEEIIATNVSHKIVFAPVETTWIIGDRDKLGQVVNNLITNAIKYSPLGSTIHIACVTTIGSHAQVSIKDEGMGINPEDIDKLFDRYYRVESTNNISGFGIGLYLSAEIIRRHNGKIWVESEKGKGSTFFFSLPLK